MELFLKQKAWVSIMNNKLPFRKMSKQNPKLKVFIWGESGCGKTPFSLFFPDPAIIDMERGTIPYADLYPDTEVFNSTNCDEVINTVKLLAKAEHDYKTLVIDSISIFWASLQKKWSDIFLKRNEKGKGYKYEYYDMQVNNWNTVKAQWNEFVRLLLALDMNVIIIARAKTLYSEDGKMTKLGIVYDAEKNLHYAFDTVVKMRLNTKIETIGVCTRDRWRRIPTGKPFVCAENFDFSKGYEFFKQRIGEDTLKRKPEAIELPKEEDFEPQGDDYTSGDLPSVIKQIRDKCIALVKKDKNIKQENINAEARKKFLDYAHKAGHSIVSSSDIKSIKMAEEIQAAIKK
jgi:hypothetical protein